MLARKKLGEVNKELSQTSPLFKNTRLGMFGVHNQNYMKEITDFNSS